MSRALLRLMANCRIVYVSTHRNHLADGKQYEQHYGNRLAIFLIFLSENVFANRRESVY